MRSFRLVAAATVGLIVVASCGAAERVIDTTTVLTTLRQEGFGPLKVRAYAQSDSDWIYAPGFPVARVEEMPIQAVRLANVSAAKRRYANDLPLLEGKLSARDRALLPRGFQRLRLSEERVCNVVLDSYNASGSATLTRLFAAAVSSLRKRC